MGQPKPAKESIIQQQIQSGNNHQDLNCLYSIDEYSIKDIAEEYRIDRWRVLSSRLN